MHFNNLKQYYFVNTYNQNDLGSLSKYVRVIYRNYNKPKDIIKINKIKNFCKLRGIKFYVANEIKLALKLGLDGVYLPSFNKEFTHNSYKYNKNFKIIGSAHNMYDVKIKIRQKSKEIFLAPIFKKKNNRFIGLYNLQKYRNLNSTNLIALGGIDRFTIKKLLMIKADGFAAINFFKKKGP